MGTKKRSPTTKLRSGVKMALNFAGVPNIFNPRGEDDQTYVIAGKRKVPGDIYPVQALIETSNTDTTEDTTTSATYTTLKSITLTPASGINNQVLKVVAQYDAKTDIATGKFVRIEETNLTNGSSAPLVDQTINTSYATYSETRYFSTNYSPGSTYTFEVKAKGGSGPTVTTYVKNVIITVFYLDNTAAETGSDKWSAWT